MRIFILPVLFFLPALFVEYLQYNDILPRYNFLHISHLFSSVKLLCYCCYCLQAFLCSFLSRKPNDWGFGIIRDLPLQMLIHFRTIYCFLKMWMLEIPLYIFMALEIIRDASTRRTVGEIMMRLCGLCLFMLFAPIIVFQWLMMFLLVVCCSFPMALVCGTEYFSFSRNTYDNFDDRIPFTSIGKYILVFCISCFGTHGGLLVYPLQVSVYCYLLNWQGKFCFVRKVSRTLLLLGFWPILCGVATVHLPKDTKNSPGRSVTILKNR